MRRVIHAITPGDHYSPRTGSAIPTVVHGLAGAAARDLDGERYEQFAAVEAGTYEPRYDTATPIEFPHAAPPSDRQRALDAVLGRLGAPRVASARYFGPLARALRAQDPAIVLAHNATALPRLLRSSPHRVVLYAHNDVLRSMSRAEAGRTLRGVAAIVCVSEFLAERLAARLPAELADRLHVVVNGVDCAQFAPAGERPDGERLRVMFVGRMIPDKGPDLLLEAAARLARDDLELTLVGSHGFDPGSPLSPYEQRLRELARAVPGPVAFLPSQPRGELASLLRSADVLVVPSRWPEPCGLTVGEGLASGLAVVAAQIGGIPEVLGEAGVTFRADDAADLARALAQLAEQPASRLALAAAARRRAQERDWDWAWSELKGVLAQL